ncbi:glycosyltransferase family 4 protein [Singulisphaera sp. Ch08]|uniref:Glycosyltransferase family 4 protein n=1 Tax=Singulisphaera sp. Ch08 TaxID=3120278 RepID=A0AAU7CEF1_9BACT
MDPTHFNDTDVEIQILERWRPIVDADLPDADVVIATWWETAEWVAELSPRKGAQVYFVQHHETFSYLPIDRVEATWRLPLHKIAVAQWLVDLARERYDDHDVSLVSNAVDHDLFHAPPRGKNPTPTVGLMYATADFKGCDISLRAFDLSKQRNADLRLVAFGTEPPSAWLPLPPLTEYHLKPLQHELREIYARCDALLFGSRSEGFGLPILEAMACRTPVIGTPAGVAPELLSGGGGILVAAEDPESMARGVERIVGLSDERWKAMSETAFVTAARYTWENATDQFEAALKRVLEKAQTLVRTE